MAKTEDLQEAYGNGNMSGYVNDSTKYYGVLASGSMDDKGQFYGYNAGNKQIKVFHTEAMWGDQWERICQMVCDKGVVKVQPYGDCNLTGAGFEKVLDFADYGVSGSVGGYMKDTVIGIVYLIGAIITFIGLFAFFTWAAKADAKEQELYPEYPIEDENEPFSLYITVVFIISIMTAIIWWGVPLLLGGLLLYDKITQEYPQLMGGINDTEEKENGKE